MLGLKRQVGRELSLRPSSWRSWVVG